MHTRLKDLRTKYLKERGIVLTQKELAERIGLSENYVWMIEKGTRTPADRVIADICDEFGCNEIWLRTGEGEPFDKLSIEAEIMRFAVATGKGSDGFRKSFAAMLAKLEPEDWEALSKIFAKLAEEAKKE